MTHPLQIIRTSLLALVASAGLPTVGLAVTSSTSTVASAQNTSSDAAQTRRAKRDTLLAMSKPITLDVTDQPLGDLFDFMSDVTGTDLEPIFLTDNIASNGMDPETPITIKVSNTPALAVLEKVLLRAQRAESTGDEYTWQFTDLGTIECGPKTELNRNQRVELYDIADLLFVVPDFDNAPQFDLQSAVQAAGGGGGGGGGSSSSPFTGGTQNVDIPDSATRAQAITDLIQSTIEPDQWAALGGDGASMTFYGTSFIITAPDYIHRQIAGYSFWPANLQQARRVDGKWQTTIKADPKQRHKKP
ncbi:MAG: hypothetical protein ACWA5W_05815 [Phycisphaerales bacterium]